MLIADLKITLEAIVRFCPSLANEPEARLAALVDFTFNLGARRLPTSTFRRWVNELNWPAAAELRRWVLGGGKVLPRLMSRRQAAVALLVG